MSISDNISVWLFRFHFENPPVYCHDVSTVDGTRKSDRNLFGLSFICARALAFDWWFFKAVDSSISCVVSFIKNQIYNQFYNYIVVDVVWHRLDDSAESSRAKVRLTCRTDWIKWIYIEILCPMKEMICLPSHTHRHKGSGLSLQIVWHFSVEFKLIFDSISNINCFFFLLWSRWFSV